MPERDTQGRRQGEGNRRHRHHQPARDHGRLGSQERKGRSPGDRVAGPPHGRRLCGPQKSRSRGGHRLAHRPAARSVFLGDQGCVDTRPCEGCPRARAKGRTGIRHGRQLSDLALHRRAGPCDRCHQCFAHAPLQHSQGRVGRRSARSPQRAEVDAAGGEEFGSGFRKNRGCSSGRRGHDIRHGGRSAGGDGRPGMFSARHDQVDLWNRLLTTIAYQFNGKPTYALEGSIFIAGAAVQWLRDGLKLIKKAADSAALAAKADPEQAVYLVPAFVGLGAPYWDADARGLIYGITRGTSAAELARAALESVCYQTRDLLEAMRGDWPTGSAAQTVLRVDGGMVASNWTMQFLADILDAPVDRPKVMETTALGAAYLAGLQAGLLPEPEAFAKHWRLDRRFQPKMGVEERARKYAGWRDAVRR